MTASVSGDIVQGSQIVSVLDNMVNQSLATKYRWEKFRQESRLLSIISSREDYNGGPVPVNFHLLRDFSIMSGSFTDNFQLSVRGQTLSSKVQNATSDLVTSDNSQFEFFENLWGDAQGRVDSPKIITATMDFHRRDLIEHQGQYSDAPGLSPLVQNRIDEMMSYFESTLSMMMCNGGELAKINKNSRTGSTNNNRPKHFVDKIHNLYQGQWVILGTNVPVATGGTERAFKPVMIYEIDSLNNLISFCNEPTTWSGPGDNLANLSFDNTDYKAADNISLFINSVASIKFGAPTQLTRGNATVNNLPSIPELLNNSKKIHGINRLLHYKLRSINLSGANITTAAAKPLLNLTNFVLGAVELGRKKYNYYDYRVLISTVHAQIIQHEVRGDRNLESIDDYSDKRGLATFGIRGPFGTITKFTILDHWPDDKIAIINPETLTFMSNGGIRPAEGVDWSRSQKVENDRSIGGIAYRKDFFIECQFICTSPYQNILIHNIPFNTIWEGYVGTIASPFNPTDYTETKETDSTDTNEPTSAVTILTKTGSAAGAANAQMVGNDSGVLIIGGATSASAVSNKWIKAVLTGTTATLTDVTPTSSANTEREQGGAAGGVAAGVVFGGTTASAYITTEMQKWTQSGTGKAVLTQLSRDTSGDASPISVVNDNDGRAFLGMVGTATTGLIFGGVYKSQAGPREWHDGKFYRYTVTGNKVKYKILTRSESESEAYLSPRMGHAMAGNATAGVVFGGIDNKGRYSNGMWRYSVSGDTVNIAELTPLGTVPPKLFGAEIVGDGNSGYIYGGLQADSGRSTNTIWKYVINVIAQTVTYYKVNPTTGTVPSKFGHSMVNNGKTLITYGGRIFYSYTRQGTYDTSFRKIVASS